MRYFNISNGLRGCYMPDNAYMIAVKTRRDLRDAIESEARDLRDAGYIGASKRAVSALAAQAWAESGKAKPLIYDSVMSLAPPHCPREYSYGLHVSVASRADYLAYQEDESC